MNIETLYFLVETIAVTGFYGVALLGTVAALFEPLTYDEIRSYGFSHNRAMEVLLDQDNLTGEF